MFSVQRRGGLRFGSLQGLGFLLSQAFGFCQERGVLWITEGV